MERELANHRQLVHSHIVQFKEVLIGGRLSYSNLDSFNLASQIVTHCSAVWTFVYILSDECNVWTCPMISSVAPALYCPSLLHLNPIFVVLQIDIWTSGVIPKVCIANSKENFINPLQLWYSVRTSTNVWRVLCTKVFLTPTHLAIVMEYAAGGELFDFLCKRRFLTENEARYFFQQLICGLEYCHSMVSPHYSCVCTCMS